MAAQVSGGSVWPMREVLSADAGRRKEPNFTGCILKMRVVRDPLGPFAPPPGSLSCLENIQLRIQPEGGFLRGAFRLGLRAGAVVCGEAHANGF